MKKFQQSIVSRFEIVSPLNRFHRFIIVAFKATEPNFGINYVTEDKWNNVENKLKNNYAIAKKAYKIAITLGKNNFEQEKVENLLENCKLKDLYKKFGKQKTDSSINQDIFLTYCQKLFNSEQEEIIPHYEDEEEESEEDPNIKGKLNRDISQEEIWWALETNLSKAKSSDGLSGQLLKKNKQILAPILCKIFNHCLRSKTFQKNWMINTMIFLYKGKGERNVPENYRTIAIQHPFLKAFMKIMYNKIELFLENNNILPSWQFGFRKFRSAKSAIFTLHEISLARLNKKLKTYILMVDFKKCFDSINRSILYRKLEKAGIPKRLILMLCYIYNNTLIKIKVGKGLSVGFLTRIGLPQGCSLSALLFTAFIADLENTIKPEDSNIKLEKDGVSIAQTILGYADDLGILASNIETLKDIARKLEDYCNINELCINTNKTKVLVIQRGKPARHTLQIYGREIEFVTSFKYLGVTLTSGLSYHSHIMNVVAKAKTKIGYLNAKLRLANLSMDLAKKVFLCYIRPILEYGVEIWWSKFNNNSEKAIESVWTKFLKMCLCLPKMANNAFTIHVTTAIPIMYQLQLLYQKNMDNLRLPHLVGYILDRVERNYLFSYTVEHVPSYFWRGKIFQNIPINTRYKKLLMTEIFGLNHKKYCGNNQNGHTPHLHKDVTNRYENCYAILRNEKTYCLCIACGQQMSFYHEYFCQENYDRQ